MIKKRRDELVSVTSTAKRRRRQMKNGERHLPPLLRPRRVKRNTETLQEREARYREKQKAMMTRKGAKK